MDQKRLSVCFATTICLNKTPGTLSAVNTARILLLILILAVPTALQAQFNYATNFGSITITKYIGNGGAVTIPDVINELPVTIIGWGAFENCRGMTSVTIPASVVAVEGRAFAGCVSLGTVTIPNKVNSIGDWAFYLSGVKFITIPDSVLSIGNSVFYDSGLNNIKIGKNVTTIGANAFMGCVYLNAITVDESNPAYSSSAGVLFNKNKTTLICFPGGRADDYRIPNGVANIEINAFCGAFNHVTGVTIPNSVTNIGDGAFLCSWNLTNICFLGDAPSLGSWVFNSDTNATVYYLPGTRGWETSYGELPTAPWVLPNPLILNYVSNVGVKSNGFGFTISWATNAPVVVEACGDLADTAWIPLQTNSLVNGSSYFNDLDRTNHPTRLYRLRMQ